MKDVLIIAHFTQVPGEKGNSRFTYLANMLADNDFNVELVTTNFSHISKDQRNVSKYHLKKLKYKLTMLYESGYQKNVSLTRLYSHYVFGKNLRKYLEKRTKPDIIYCAVPSLDAAYIAAEYSKRNDIKFIIDIQDLWPEAFKMIFKIPIINDLIFAPFQKKADFIYSAADEIIAVSNTYAARALKTNKKRKISHTIYLGTDLSYFDELAKEGNKIKKSRGEVWLAYIGTLGHSYDLICVIDALKILKDKGIKNINFIIMGEGPLKNKFIEYAKSKGIKCNFTGRLDYSNMVKLLVNCDIAVNPIVKGAAASIINKVGDYAAAGLPVLNTQESKEYRELLCTYNAGLNCETGNPFDLADKILLLYNNLGLRKKLGKNNRKLAEDKFDRKKTYLKILEILGD